MLIASCAQNDPATQRKRIAAQEKGPITIAVVWPDSGDHDQFRPAVDMALAEVNEQGVLGRRLEIVWREDHSSINDGRIIAQELSEDPRIVAVIGHKNSYVSIPASAIYEFAGMIMLSPTSTSPKLTEQGFRNIFRMIPNDYATGRVMAEHAHAQGYRRITIFYVKNRYGLDLANAFEKRARQLQMEVVDRHSFREANKGHFQNVIDIWQDLEFDAVFVAGSMPDAGDFIVQLRDNGIVTPVIGGDGLDYNELCELGPASEGVTVASSFDPREPRPEVQQFSRAFEQHVGKSPGAKAALGYDAVKLLAYAIETAGTSAPDAVAAALRQITDWSGVTGVHTFDGRGDVTGKKIVLKQVQNSRFELLN